MCHRLCSAEVLLGIISFSPAKGRGEVTRLLMTLVFRGACFPAGCAGFSPWKPNPSRSGCGQQGLWGVGCAPPVPCWAQAIPAPCHCLCDTPRHSPVPALWLLEQPLAPRAPQSLCRQGQGDSLMDRCFPHERELGAAKTTSFSAKISWKLFCRSPQCSRGLLSVFRLIQNIGRRKNFGACFCVWDELRLNAVNNDLCQT